jgi:transposase
MAGTGKRNAGVVVREERAKASAAAFAENSKRRFRIVKQSSGSRPIGGYRRSRIAQKEQQLRAWIAERPDLTLAELQQRLEQQGVVIKIGALWHQMSRWNLAFKKNPARQRARARRRAAGAADVA